MELCTCWNAFSLVSSTLTTPLSFRFHLKCHLSEGEAFPDYFISTSNPVHPSAPRGGIASIPVGSQGLQSSPLRPLTHILPGRHRAGRLQMSGLLKCSGAQQRKPPCLALRTKGLRHLASQEDRPHPAPSWRASVRGCMERPEPEHLPFHPLRHRVSGGRASFDLSNCDVDGVCQKRMEERHHVLVLLWAKGGSEMEFLQRDPF